MNAMIPEAETVELVNDMGQVTGVLVSFGVNAYYVNPEPSTAFSVLIDPSSLDGFTESELKKYAERKGFKVEEEWGDWGVFIKFSKRRMVFASSFTLSLF